MSAPAILPALLAVGENAVAALAVKATLAMLAAVLLIRLARGAPASLRHLVAAAAFGVLLLLPLAAVLVPARTIAVPSAPPSRPAGPRERLAPVDRGTIAPVPSTPRPSVSLPAMAAAVYFAGLAAFVVAPLLGVWRLRRVHREAEVSVAGTRLANEMARREGLRDGIEVAVSSALAVPITFGWTRAVVLLPAEAAEWGHDALSRAVRHELEHVARWDWAVHIAARLAVALYWPHPMAWQLWRRLRLEAERACDDAVIRSQGQPEPYAEQLVSLARRLGGGTVPALSMATRSNLGQRIEAILDDRRRRSPRSRVTALLGAAAAVACVLTIAPFRLIAAALPHEAGPVALADDDEGDDASVLEVALMEAAGKGQLERMQRLLDKGARADAVISGDGSPLIVAARRGRVKAMEILIAAGADVNRGVAGDGNPLTMAAKGGHLEAVRLLLDRGAEIDRGVRGDGNALIMASGAGRLEVVSYLLDRGASIEAVVPGDENPLIKASEAGATEAVKLLIARGANVNARVWAAAHEGRGEWRTPLLMARRHNHHEVVRILQAAGAHE